MKKKLPAIALTIVLLCGIAAAVASAAPWNNWELWSTFGFGHDENDAYVRWICTEIGTGKLKMISEKGFETEKEAGKFIDGCFTDQEKEKLITDKYSDGYGFDEELSKKLFKDDLFHPVIEYPSFDVNKLAVINVHGAHRIIIKKDYSGSMIPVPEDVDKQLSFSVDPWFRWARPGDQIDIKVIIPHNVSMHSSFLINGSGAQVIVPSTGTPHTVISMGTDDLTVVYQPSYHGKNE